MRSVDIQVDIARKEKFADEIYNRKKRKGMPWDLQCEIEFIIISSEALLA
jgi:hypothetical protein